MILTNKHHFIHLLAIAVLLVTLMTISAKGQEKEDGGITYKTFTVPSGDEIRMKVTKIWDKAPHNAFTDLIRFGSRFYVAFRVSARHVPRNSSEDGKIRVLTSSDGEKWKPFALLKLEGYDLRDPHLSVTPEGKLMLLMGGSVYQNGKLRKKRNHVSYLDAGANKFSTPEPLQYGPELESPQNWLWAVTWHKQTAYGVIYRGGKVLLVKSEDGLHFSLVTPLHIDHFPNESWVEFLPDDEMMIVVRRDGRKLKPAQRLGVIGKSKPPYADWEWNTMDVRLGGPQLIPLKSGLWVLGTRAFSAGQPKVTTALFTMDEEGQTTKLTDLPSGGDTSYPGMVIYEDTLWISYYSSHEGKANIYIAQMPVW